LDSSLQMKLKWRWRYFCLCFSSQWVMKQKRQMLLQESSVRRWSVMDSTNLLLTPSYPSLPSLLHYTMINPTSSSYTTSLHSKQIRTMISSASWLLMELMLDHWYTLVNRNIKTLLDYGWLTWMLEYVYTLFKYITNLQQLST